MLGELIKEILKALAVAAVELSAWLFLIALAIVGIASAALWLWHTM